MNLKTARTARIKDGMPSNTLTQTERLTNASSNVNGATRCQTANSIRTNSERTGFAARLVLQSKTLNKSIMKKLTIGSAVWKRELINVVSCECPTIINCPDCGRPTREGCVCRHCGGECEGSSDDDAIDLDFYL